MSRISDFKVTSITYEPHELDIFWTFENPERALEVNVTVERSYSPSGPWEEIAIVRGGIHFQDRLTLVYPYRKPLYRLKVIRVSDNEVLQITDPKAWEVEPDLIALEIRRRENLMLNQFSGSEILYYPVRIDGLRCPDCWDQIAQHRIKSNCETCFGTGFVTGFYHPIFLRVQLSQRMEEYQPGAELDEHRQEQLQALIPANFPVKIGDLVLTKDNVRYVVNRYSYTTKLRAIVSYQVLLWRIPPADVKYRVPLPQPAFFSSQPQSFDYTRPYTWYLAAERV
jgi:hypothetical protein